MLTISPEGKLYLPAELLRRIGLRPGDKFYVEPSKGSLLIWKVPPEELEACDTSGAVPDDSSAE